MIRYRDQFIQLWNSELSRQSKRGEAGNKLRTYRLFKSRFQLEGYLSQVKVAKYRIALVMLLGTIVCGLAMAITSKRSN